MKLCRFGPPGKERPGLLDTDGRIRDLSAHVTDIDASVLAPAALAELSKLDVAGLPVVEEGVRYGVPVAQVRKFIAIGLNYRDHAEEAGMAIPTEPIIFHKAISCLSGPDDDIVQPPHSTKLDWELELGVVIGSEAQYVSEANALDYVAGYCVVNDVSERAFQMQSSQWDKGKGCDTFGPIGPWLVTRDEVADPQNLDMWLDVNGERRQIGNSKTMIFSVAQIVSYCSRYMTLQPGDVICTGTPPGVGMGMKPEPQWLHPGDQIHLWIDGLGEQRQKVVPAR
ncbi:FAA hydrolase family protein [Pseudomonas sp. FW306-02-F02-AA]|jgi:2-keto-4-pentenoate hydratase/2-oxohepta-3-ene-1,7-dioic acid hydratase in catechol pathway|uniref:2-keto-4-pentenoate hydratase/2-oxohepta-3-ene-1,7-dioic acid hydratase in catechol pathway n=2 Tax=Pseudomonas TaxID=286 RepID=A0ACC5M8D5_9PSED|nr:MULTISPECIES: fumarylacetoacetate hydrolase family protein [Pseudomonas]URM27118.1 fumarylacetoacetate hydrolase family protein [Pseudomonas frederiksbergensis]ALI04036.1 2-hydroxyhepta-2,4-diene-1,7-dioate isomerase [Pseudomonas fluorescens]MBB2884992.1 2-keto-4-pentenoate hydratase/2-oxohepta-3-ene-1,7-dioic acid hydratase in catechol pathway [Pseudomonas umsongensis]NMN74640.1 2-keto-4-pentenoate hydratase/2-oxohepta-3-ene-1,7-dioic acid hydratase in catechol pathway [Pseudomonas sp. KD5]